MSGLASIFLSHTHADKPFVRQLAQDLRALGIRVWLDEAEIKLGDSLIQKIRAGIDQMEYLGVVLSKNSVKSKWVQREVDIAMNQEIEGNDIKVLPLVIDDCELPGFLVGKLYADFRHPNNYGNAFRLLAERLGVATPKRPDITGAQDIRDPKERTYRLIDISHSLKNLNEEARARDYLDWAFLAAQEISDNNACKRAFMDIAEHMAALGMSEKAIMAARKSDDLRDVALRFVAENLAVAGKTEDALASVREVSNVGHRRIGLQKIAVELAKKGEISDALKVARESEWDESIRLVVEEMVELNQIDEAINITRSIRNHEDRALAFLRIGTSVAGAGRNELANQLTTEIFKAGKNCYGDDAYPVFWQLANLYESLGNPTQAISALEEAYEACFKFDKQEEGVELSIKVEERMKKLRAGLVNGS